MTTITQKPENPTAHLTPEDIEQLGIELDAIRQDVLDDRGERDAAYIRRVISVQRRIELGSRAVLLGSALPPLFVLGTVGLSVAKILENMEIGHNVLHGQWDWMRDPKIHSTTWEWDMATPAEQWKHSHNQIHHTYTNIVGQDNDLGYGIMRVDEDQRWHPMYLAQPFWNFINACFFEYGIAAYDLELGKNLRIPADRRPAEFKENVRKVLKKIRHQATKDYVVNPALAIPFGAFVPTLTANFIANVVRNVWSHSVIMCGHFPEGVETFEKKSIPENETRGEWYLRQMLGSANISGSSLLHLMSGNLSHQIEHHLFPDLPSNRYAEIAPQGPRPVRQVRPQLLQPPDAAAGLLGVAQGGPALAAQRLAGHDHAEEPPQPAQAAVGHDHQGPEGPPRRPGPADPAGAQAGRGRLG